MILVDTSVWIEHFRGEEHRLRDYLNRGIVLGHPFVTGELACGNLKNRGYVLTLISKLPAAAKASDKEVLEFIEKRALSGLGIGYIDMHLLTSTAITTDTRLWTLDKRLYSIAKEMDLGVNL